MESKGLDFSAVPINKHLGLELRASSREGATVALPGREALTQEYGVVHGGILATVADTAAVYALHPFLEDGERMTSVEFKVNFLAPALFARGEVVAQSTVIRRGRSIAVARVDVRQADQLVLTGIFTYIILRTGGG
jgi:uncharacterized protein (TIGR00369 family)